MACADEKPQAPRYHHIVSSANLGQVHLGSKCKGLPLLTWQRFEDLVSQRNTFDKVCPAFCFFLSFGGSKAKHILALDSAMIALLSPRLTVCSSNFRFTYP